MSIDTELTNTTKTPFHQNASREVNKSILGFVLFTNSAFLAWLVMPIIFFVGIFGNSFLLTSVITQRLYNKSPIFIFLAFISAADTVSLLTAVGTDLFELIGTRILSRRVCVVKYYLHFVCNKTAVYILISAYVFKLRALHRPLDLIARDQTRRTVVICCCVLVVILLADLYQIFIDAVPLLYVTTVEVAGLRIRVHDCIYNTAYPGYNFVYPLVVTALYVAIPGVILTCLSVAILLVLQRSHRLHKLLTKTSTPATPMPSSEPRGQRGDRSVYVSAKAFAYILIAMSVLHILTSLPRYVEVAVYGSGVQTGMAGVFTRYYQMSRCVSTLNFSLNFYIQLVCSKFFRNAILPCSRQGK